MTVNLFVRCNRLATAALAPFSRCAIAVFFVLTYQSIADELYATHDKTVDAAAVQSAYATVCQRIVDEVKAAGFAAVSVSTADKTHLHLDPQVCAMMHCCSYSMIAIS